MTANTPKHPASRIRTRRRANVSPTTTVGGSIDADPVTSPDPIPCAVDSRPTVQSTSLAELKPNPGNPRKHSQRQIARVAQSIESHGFNNPILVGADNTIIAGHARFEAANRLGLTEVPVIRLNHLTAAQAIAYGMADNRLADLSEWDDERLTNQFALLLEIDADFELELTGFETAEIDLFLETVDADETDAADQMPALDDTTPVVTRLGDLWHLGEHRLLCADARDQASFEQLVDGQKARAVINDPPFNVAIHGHVCGRGRIRHRDFAMASGEMSEPEYIAFLATALENQARHCVDGALLYTFIDWRHLLELLTAARQAGLHLFNLAVWNKTNAGMGSFYRSKHELVPVFKKGRAPHTNNIELGRHGRSRSNVWDHAGVNALGKDRMEDLAAHPTVKPVALIAEAIKDCSRRGEIVLDAFVGSGTIFLAAERTGRRGHGLELDPLYVDTAIRRWEQLTGKQAVHDATGRTFAEVAAERSIDDGSPECPSPEIGESLGDVEAQFGEAEHD